MLYQEELADAIEYAKSKLNGTITVNEVAIKYINTTAGPRTVAEIKAELKELEGKEDV